MEDFKFGFSMKNPPMFLDHNFLHWKNFMITYLKSIDYDMGCILEENDFDEHNIEIKSLNNKALTIIQESLVGSKLKNLMLYTCAKKLWHDLEEIEIMKATKVESEGNSPYDDGQKATCLVCLTSCHDENDDGDGDGDDDDDDDEVISETTHSYEDLENEYAKLISLSAKVSDKNKALKIENKTLKDEIEEQKHLIAMLMKENSCFRKEKMQSYLTCEKLTKENTTLQEKELYSQKDSCFEKLAKSEVVLNDKISEQKLVNDKGGIGCPNQESTSMTKPIRYVSYPG